MLWLLMISSFALEIKGLKDIEIMIPMAIKLMDTVTLVCKYDLEGDELYTVKWYKGKREFYRYIPKELPSTQIFPLPGIDVDLSKSTPNEVVLRNVQPEVTGKYMCEVSSDAPDFDTKSKTGYMYVVDIPVDDPTLKVQKNFADIGDILSANCTTPAAFPATNISWYLNGKKITNAPVVRTELKENDQQPRKLYVSHSDLRLEIDENTFQDGKATLSCVSTLFEIYRGEKKAFIEETKPKPRPSSVMGPWEESSGSQKIQGIFQESPFLQKFGATLYIFCVRIIFY